MARLFTEKTIRFIGAFILVSILFFPPIRISPNLPVLEVTDFLIPVFALIILVKFKEINDKKLLLLLSVFGFYILMTIFINGRYTQFRDYFEIVKLIKFSCIVFIFSFINTGKFNSSWIRVSFIALVALNFVHFFNLFNLNSFLGAHYLGGPRYGEFGLNSIGLPSHKRMLGFVGNPNINSLVFAFYAIYFIPKFDTLKKTLPWFATALIMVFLCQSKTALVALAPILLAYYFLMRKEKRKVLAVITTSVVCFFIAFFITKYSVFTIEEVINENAECLECLDRVKDVKWSSPDNDSLSESNKIENYSNVDSISFIDSCLAMGYDAQETTYLETIVHGEFLGGSSMQGRYLIWKHLWQMIKKKPVFGHAPYKEYIYENQLYFENEFIAMTWRYGFIGLGIYLFLLFYLFRISYLNINKESGINLFLILILIAVSGLTNNPFTQKTIIVLFAISTGLLLNDISKKKEISSTTDSDENPIK